MFPSPPALSPSFTSPTTGKTPQKLVATHTVEIIEEQPFMCNSKFKRYLVLNGDEKYNPVWSVPLSHLADHLGISTNNRIRASIYSHGRNMAPTISAHVPRKDGPNKIQKGYIMNLVQGDDVLRILTYRSTNKRDTQYTRDMALDLLQEIEFRDTVLSLDHNNKQD